MEIERNEAAFLFPIKSISGYINKVVRITSTILIRLKLRNCIFSGFVNLGNHSDEEKIINKNIGIKIKKFLAIR